jgi:hypothetical protein
MKNIFILATLSLSILSTYALPPSSQGQDITIHDSNLNYRSLDLKTRDEATELKKYSETVAKLNRAIHDRARLEKTKAVVDNHGDSRTSATYALMIEQLTTKIQQLEQQRKILGYKES